MMLVVNSSIVNIQEISTESYNRKKHNGYLYRHSIKYPISYNRLQYYHKCKDVIYKFKKSNGISVIHKFTNCYQLVDKVALKIAYKNCQLFNDLLILLDSLIPKFSKVIVPRDLLNPTGLVSTVSEKSDLTLVINWYRSECEPTTDPSTLIINIFDL